MTRPTARAPLALALGAGLVLLYGVRAVTGWSGGMAHITGRRLAAVERFEQAIPALDRAAVGPERAEVRWLEGNVRLGLFQLRQVAGAPDEELEPLLAGAFRAETEAISLSPGSGWYWASLADVYHQRERRQRHRFGLSLELVGENRWSFVGREGRIAIGMLRMSIAREPTQYVLHDQLAFTLLDYGLREEALAAVRESARVQPEFVQHLYRNLSPVPPDLLDAFAEAARAGLGETPLTRPGMHLLALGRIELRRGRPVAAEADVRAALAQPGTEINRADAYYRLGVALEAQGRYAEAEEALVEAETHPVFAPLGLEARARIAEERGELEEALSLLRAARRLRPRDLRYALSYARMALRFGEPDWAEEALRWAALVHPDDPRPLEELERLLLGRGDVSGAREARGRIERLKKP